MVPNVRQTMKLRLIGPTICLCIWPVWDARGSDDAKKSTADSNRPPPRVVASSRVMIGYQTAAASPQVTTAELWFTQDCGQTWQRSAASELIQSPIAFDAPADGLYGLYLVLRNASGASAEAPKTGTAPQQWILVDRVAPSVQALQVNTDARFDLNREIHIRWAAHDDNLANRPVALHYRCDQNKSFQLIADDLPANGSYSWTVPEGVAGRVEIKISATDRAGNIGRYVADWLRIDGSTVSGTRRDRLVAEDREKSAPGATPNKYLLVRDPSPAATSPDRAAVRAMAPSQMPTEDSGARPHGEPDAGTESLPEGAAKEAQKCYDLGTWHRLRGEHEVAMARFRDALKLDPSLVAARNDLAGLLYLQGDYEGAERELQYVLSRDERHRPALKTLALVQATRHNYRSSAESLEKLLLLDAGDAEAWLYLGDVRLFMGERSAARDAWDKAAAAQASSAETKQRAQKRLAIYRID